jgi:hypothetical protein
MVSTNKNGSVYERMVNKRLDAEGKDADFEVGKRAWGTRIGATPFIEHNGKKYLEVFFIRAGQTHYLLDGAPVAKHDILGMPSTSVSEESQGGLENQVVVRTIALDNIRSITCNKQVYTF